jgi:hypothetical protein
MRALALALLVLACAAPASLASPVPNLGWMCIPEDPVCGPPGLAVPVPVAPDPAGQVLCPHLGMTFGWCATVGTDGHAVQASAALGQAFGPRANATSQLALDAASVDAGAKLCPPMMVILLPAPLPFNPCAASADAGAQL